MATDQLILIYDENNINNPLTLYDVYTVDPNNHFVRSYLYGIAKQVNNTYKKTVVLVYLVNKKPSNNYTLFEYNNVTPPQELFYKDNLSKFVEQAMNKVAKTCKSMTKPIRQVRGTCWFNSVVNGMLAGERFQQLIYCLYFKDFIEQSKKVSEKNKTDVNAGTNSCPITFDKSFLQHIMELQTTLKSIDNFTEIKQQYDEQITLAMKSASLKVKPLIVKEGWFPILALPKVLDALKVKATYITYNDLLSSKFPDIIEPVLIVNANMELDTFVPEEDVTEVLNIGDKAYLLDHANISLSFSKGPNHVVTGLPRQYDCFNSPFLYDSNYGPYFIPFNWLNVDTLKRTQSSNSRITNTTFAETYKEKIKKYSISYLVYVDEKITDYYCKKKSNV